MLKNYLPDKDIHQEYESAKKTIPLIGIDHVIKIYVVKYLCIITWTYSHEKSLPVQSPTK